MGTRKRKKTDFYGGKRVHSHYRSYDGVRYNQSGGYSATKEQAQSKADRIRKLGYNARIEKLTKPTRYLVYIKKN